MDESVLQGVNLKRSYQGKIVLNDINFQLSPGECLGIAGHNGSGKSTLLRLVAQTIPPESGDILYGSQSVLRSRKFLRSTLGYVPQHNSLLPDLTVLETLSFWQRVYGAHSELFAPTEISGLMGLATIARLKVGNLSGGMQKRVSLAIGLLHHPKIILLDEVLSPLDLYYRDALEEYLKYHLSNRGSILYCSHELNSLRQTCKDLLVLRDGITVFSGPAQEFPEEKDTVSKLMNSSSTGFGS